MKHLVEGVSVCLDFLQMPAFNKLRVSSWTLSVLVPQHNKSESRNGSNSLQPGDWALAETATQRFNIFSCLTNFSGRTTFTLLICDWMGKASIAINFRTGKSQKHQLILWLQLPYFEHFFLFFFHDFSMH